MGNCQNSSRNHDPAAGVSTSKPVSNELAKPVSNEPYPTTSDPPPTNQRWNHRKSIISSTATGESSIHLALPQNYGEVNLFDSLEASAVLLGTRAEEADLNKDELTAALKVYHELQRLLTAKTKTGDTFARPDSLKHQETPFHTRYQALLQEFDEADQSSQKCHSKPASVQPVNRENLHQVDFFILDNSLRETTVGASRGHTLEEKHAIIKSLADTELTEIILGSFGSKIAVDSQIAQQWTKLGKTFDQTWGFSESYDMEPYDEEPLWQSVPDFLEREAKGESVPYYVPPHVVKCKYSKEDHDLFKEASKGFMKNAFGGKKLKKVLQQSQSDLGRVPLGLLMLAGHGICNAIIEIDTAVETFDYDTFDIVERCNFLIDWCKTHLPRRKNVPPGEDDAPRVLVNLRDFSNYHRSESGLENCLRLVDALSRRPPSKRPFGFMMEEPTGWLLPDEVGRLVRMIRLTMERAGFPQGRFLVHLHWYFGMAEASTLAALCNGADGVWAAVCKTGAQTGHACSTVTAVNLLRAGNPDISRRYNLNKMCKAAREITEITTREPCPTHEEVYGEQAFDIPYFMVNIPACRFSLALLLEQLGIDRTIRLNEICMPSSVEKAMEHYFGPPEKAGWDPAYCTMMLDAIHNHLLTGLSRDYNSALGLGHLYSLVSKKQIPKPMVRIMMGHSSVSDYHPTVLEFIQRWNRLCAKFEGEELPPHPASRSKSILMWCTDVTVHPRRRSLPFEYFLTDVLRNPMMEPIPHLFKLQIITLLAKDERSIQGKKIPEIDFYESIVKLKLFIQEADSLGVLPTVDDFVIRKNHDFFFGEDNLWLQQVRGNRSKLAPKLLRKHIDYFPQYYAKQGNNAMLRCVRSAAKRISENEGIGVRDDVKEEFRRESAMSALLSVEGYDLSGLDSVVDDNEAFNTAQQKLIQELDDDEGQDEELAAEYLEEVKGKLGITESQAKDFRGELVAAYMAESRNNIFGQSGHGESKTPSGRGLASRFIRESIRVFDTVVDDDQEGE